MSEKKPEKSEMSTIEFVADALREDVAPRSLGSVKERIRHAARALGWSFSRTKDVWYQDPRVAVRCDELRMVEDYTGLRYGRQEVRQNDDLIARANALLEGPDADFYRPFVIAFRAFVGSLDRPGIGRERD